MLPWASNVRQAFLALASHATVAGPLCRATVDGSFGGVTQLRDICAAAGIAEARSSAVEAALVAGEACGLFVRCGLLEWRPQNMSFAELAIALEAVAAYRQHVHVDTDIVDVVLTPPGNPSQLGMALRTRGWVEADLEHTDAIFRHLATQATNRFAVLSPFIDEGGVEKLIGLFTATKNDVDRVLVARCPNGVMPAALQARLSTLDALGVSIFSYWLPRNVGYETFHAKILLIDAEAAYIGSANMTQASLLLSMELGIFLRGRSVKTIVEIIDAILSIATRVP